VLLGELIGPAELKRALEQAGETHALDAETDVAPLSLPSSALHEADFAERTSVSDFPEARR